MPERTFNVLFVCTGNTCRSPMATGILHKLLREREIDQVGVGSAGIATLPNAPASQLAVDTCQAFGIDISQHFARQLTARLALQADLILVMSPEHRDYAVNLDSRLAERTFLLKSFPAGTKNGNNLSVKDPLGAGKEAYLRCFLELDETLRRVLPGILERVEKDED